MNEELQKVLVEILNTTLDAKDFLIEEIPEVVQQLLLYKGIVSGLSMVCFFLFCYILYWGNKKQIEFIKETVKQNSSDFVDILPLIAPVNFIQIIIGIPLLNVLWSMDWLMILLAPKLYLIEYASKLVG